MNKESSDNLRLPLWVISISLAVSIVLLGLMLSLDLNVYSDRDSSWFHFLLLAPAYFFIQIFVEAILGEYWESHSWLAKALPVVLLICFYLAFFKLSP